MQESELVERVLDTTDSIFSANGFKEKKPIQKKLINRELIKSNSNLIVVSPTDSGKTAGLYPYILYAIEKKQTVVYIVPYRALKKQKIKELKNTIGKEHPKIEIGGVGKYDSTENKDIIVLTHSQFNHIIRNKTILNSIGLLIYDEIHVFYKNFGNSARDAEVGLTYLKMNNPQTRIIGLSATFNPTYFKDWLDATVVKNEFPRTDLKYEIVDDWSKHNTKKEAISHFIKDRLSINESERIYYCIFSKKECNKQAVAIAENFGLFQEFEIGDFPKNEEETNLIEKVKSCLRRGVMIHHGGISKNVREGYLSKKLKNKDFRVVVGTTTLGEGVNIDFDVIILYGHKFSKGTAKPLSKWEFIQIGGRASRGDKSKGLVVVFSKDNIYHKYVKNPHKLKTFQEVNSTLDNSENIKYVLISLIADEVYSQYQDILSFFKGTFFHHKNLVKQDYPRLTNRRLDTKLKGKIDGLENSGLIELAATGKYSLTKKGKVYYDFIAEQYNPELPIDEFLLVYDLAKNKDNLGELDVRELIFKLKSINKLYKNKDKPQALKHNEIHRRYGFDCKSLKDTAACYSVNSLKAWINNEDLREIEDVTGLFADHLPVFGATVSKIINLIIEIRANLTNLPTDYLSNLQKRMKFGIREDELDLIKAKQVGRVTLRKIRNRFRNTSALIEIYRENDKHLFLALSAVPREELFDILTEIKDIGEERAKNIDAAIYDVHNDFVGGDFR